MLLRTALPDITPPPVSRREVSSDDLATVFPFYKCSMCEFLGTDNRYVAQHAVMNHRTGDVSSDYNGCFVRVLKINKPKVLPQPATLSYAQVTHCAACVLIEMCRARKFVNLILNKLNERQINIIEDLYFRQTLLQLEITFFTFL